MLKLSVLDQSPIRSGGTAAETLGETITLAQAAERAGYHRYWCAEHHASRAFAGPAPEILIARLGAATRTIRIGAGGVMLSHYSPLKVAENFRVLETLYPGRIDLGIGRAPGSDQATALALAYGSEIGIEYFPTRIADLLAFLTDSEPPSKALARIEASPRPDDVPEVWLLGSSDQSALYAAHFGVAFSFAQFIEPRHGRAVLKTYRDGFKPSELYFRPATSIGVFVVCADTREEAMKLATSRDLVSLRRAKGEHGPFPSVAEALAYPYDEADRALIERERQRLVIGDPGECRRALEEMAADYGVDELVILTICHAPEARQRSYELLAREFGLKKPD